MFEHRQRVRERNLKYSTSSTEELGGHKLSRDDVAPLGQGGEDTPSQ